MTKRILNRYRRYFWSCEKYAKFLRFQNETDCLISTKSFSYESYLINIGNGCRIMQGLSFYIHGELWSLRKKLNEKLDFFEKIEIGDYTYIGKYSKIMAGVTIGNDVIVRAGNIVTKTIIDGKTYAGNPGKIISETKDFIKKVRLYNVESKGMKYEAKKQFLVSLSDEKFITK